MEYVNDVLVSLKTVPDISFASFKRVWREKGARLIHLIPHLGQRAAEAEEPRQLLKSIFKSLTEYLQPGYGSASAAAGSTTSAAAGTESAIAGPNTPVFVVYCMYVLCATQTNAARPVKIKLPEVMWTTLLDLTRQFKALPNKDPYCVLRKMRAENMFVFSLAYPYESTAPDAELDIYSTNTNRDAKLELRGVTESTVNSLIDLTATLDIQELKKRASEYHASTIRLFPAHTPATNEVPASDKVLEAVKSVLESHSDFVQSYNAQRAVAAAPVEAIPDNRFAAAASAAGITASAFARNDTLRSILASQPNALVPAAPPPGASAVANAAQPVRTLTRLGAPPFASSTLDSKHSRPNGVAAAASSSSSSSAAAGNGSAATAPAAKKDVAYLARITPSFDSRRAVQFAGPLTDLNLYYETAQYRTHEVADDTPLQAPASPTEDPTELELNAADGDHSARKRKPSKPSKSTTKKKSKAAASGAAAAAGAASGGAGSGSSAALSSSAAAAAVAASAPNDSTAILSPSGRPQRSAARTASARMAEQTQFEMQASAIAAGGSSMSDAAVLEAGKKFLEEMGEPLDTDAVAAAAIAAVLPLASAPAASKKAPASGSGARRGRRRRSVLSSGGVDDDDNDNDDEYVQPTGGDDDGDDPAADEDDDDDDDDDDDASGDDAAANGDGGDDESDADMDVRGMSKSKRTKKPPPATRRGGRSGRGGRGGGDAPSTVLKPAIITTDMKQQQLFAAQAAATFGTLTPASTAAAAAAAVPK